MREKPKQLREASRHPRLPESITVSTPPADALAWRELPLHFAVHIAVGVGMFVLVGIAAFGLHLFIHLLEAYHFARLPLYILTALKWAIFTADVALFTIFFVRSFIHHVKLFTRLEVQ